MTFLLTDVEGSTRALERLGATAYGDALRAHQRVIPRSPRPARQASRSTRRATRSSACLLRARRGRGGTTDPRRARRGPAPRPGRAAYGRAAPRRGEVHRPGRAPCGAYRRGGHGGQIRPLRLDRGRPRAHVVTPARPRRAAAEGPLRADPPVPARRRGLPAAADDPSFEPPRPATPFIGRSAEVADIADCSRVGPGSSPSPAPAAAARPASRSRRRPRPPRSSPTALTWQALAPLRDPDLVTPSLAGTLGVKADEASVDAIGTALAGQRRLLVIDNCEHLLPGVAVEIARLREACPSVTLLVTSRERLQLAGEHVYPVAGLDDADSVELFLSRAAAAAGSGADAEPVEAVRQLCERLDRLPLAIELAAARAAALRPAQLLERLGRRLDLLKGGRTPIHASSRSGRRSSGRTTSSTTASGSSSARSPSSTVDAPSRRPRARAGRRWRGSSRCSTRACCVGGRAPTKSLASGCSRRSASSASSSSRGRGTTSRRCAPRTRAGTPRRSRHASAGIPLGGAPGTSVGHDRDRQPARGVHLARRRGRGGGSDGDGREALPLLPERRCVCRVRRVGAARPGARPTAEPAARSPAATRRDVASTSWATGRGSGALRGGGAERRRRQVTRRFAGRRHSVSVGSWSRTATSARPRRSWPRRSPASGPSHSPETSCGRCRTTRARSPSPARPTGRCPSPRRRWRSRAARTSSTRSGRRRSSSHGSRSHLGDDIGALGHAARLRRPVRRGRGPGCGRVRPLGRGRRPGTPRAHERCGRPRRRRRPHPHAARPHRQDGRAGVAQEAHRGDARPRRARSARLPRRRARRRPGRSARARDGKLPRREPPHGRRRPRTEPRPAASGARSAPTDGDGLREVARLCRVTVTRP